MIRAFRQSPNSEYARGDPQPARLHLDQRTSADGVRLLCVVLRPAVVRAGQRGCAPGRRDDVRGRAITLTWGVITGLVVGKFIGITGATALVRAAGMGVLAPGLTLRRVAGGAALSGIGFTISLFIIDLAIEDPERQDSARVGVLAASVLALAVGWVTFRITDWLSPPVAVGMTLIREVDPNRDHLRGDPDAPLTLVEYGDFECPFCSRATGAIDEVREYFGPDRLRYVWRHLPLERVHPHAMDAARASEAAALQGRFLDLAIKMFEFQEHLEWEHIYRYADGVGIDIAKFDDDLHSPQVLHRVQDDAQDAELMDLGSTPTFFVNGRRHSGPWDAASLIRALEAKD